MPQIEFKQGSMLCSTDEPIENLLIITKGSAEVSFCGRPFRLEQGDTIGLCDLDSGIHGRSYNALTDITAFSYPYEDLSSLEKLLRNNSEVANLLVASMCRQTTELMQHWVALKELSETAYDLIDETYNEYERLCKLYAVTPKKLSGLDEVEPASTGASLDFWTYNYYMGIKDLDPNVLKIFFRNPAISFGFLRRCAEDITQVWSAYDVYQEYLKALAPHFLNESGHDLFSLVAELHFDSINVKGADAAVEALMAPILGILGKMTAVDRSVVQERLRSYKSTLDSKRASRVMVSSTAASGPKQNLSDSLAVILTYSEIPEEDRNKFARHVNDYRALSDRTGSDDVAYKLRRELSKSFYDVYNAVFLKSLKDPAIPTIIKMFLNFGYVDAALAGHDNADFLYSIADSLKGDPANGVYTVCEWLHAIYKGEKEPSRNDFDEDFDAYVRDLKVQRKIDDKEEARLLADLDAKVRFELESVFPITNKITFGRMSTYCPLFGDHNVQRGLEASMVTPAAIKETFDEIREIDYSAFYRESMFSRPEIGIPKEYINNEVLPDVILMPNMGTRGAMWQEMEGRKRNTPARMFLPMFLLDDMKALLIRLTAEFRWEMCKRIHGVRWSDLSDPSLTSEFFNYLQFYKSNRELSQEVKTAIKTELVRAKNVFKAVFVSNYYEWMQYEANGSPRLNKFVRKIMLNYCPFKFQVRQKLSSNPQFAEIVKRFDVKQAQRLHHLERVFQKIKQTTGGGEIPPELLAEMEYANN